MNNITLIIAIFFLSLIDEYLVKELKPLIPETEYPVPLLLALVIGVILSFLTGADFFVAIGLEVQYPIVSRTLTGVLIGGGSSALHELIAKLRASRIDIEEQ